MFHMRVHLEVLCMHCAMVCTRLKIAHAVGVLSRYMSKPGKEHWTTVKRVFRYVRGTARYGLCYEGRLGLDRVVDIHGFVDLPRLLDLSPGQSIVDHFRRKRVLNGRNP
jgi:hypothetical protein